MAADERTSFEVRFRFNSWFSHQPLHSARAADREPEVRWAQRRAQSHAASKGRT